MEDNKKLTIKRVSDIIPTTEIEKWNQGDIITITAGCDSGKSYFIKNTLYEYAKAHNQRILMLIHRKNTVDQFLKEIERDGKTDVIDIHTYQKIDNLLKPYQSTDGQKFNLNRYSYIVSDEFHYFVEDSRFNHYTDLSFYTIIENNNITRIFMSATCDIMKTILKKTLKEYNFKNSIIEYSLPITFEHIRSLTFYGDDRTVEVLINQWKDTDEKAIIFLRSCKLAYEIYSNYKKDSMFLCSEYNKEYSPYIDTKKKEKLLESEKFNDKFLITTSCLDSGANICDPKVTKVIVDIRDFNSMIQCIGRKRVQNPNDKIDLYIKICSNQQLNGQCRKTQKELEPAIFLLNHNVQEYIKEYGREQDKTRTVYDYTKMNKHKNTGTKRINHLMYEKRVSDIERYNQMLEYKKDGFCKYVAAYLGFYDSNRNEYFYCVMSENYDLKSYLQSIVNKVMLRHEDREDLIEKLHVCSNCSNKVLSSINTLNDALKSNKELKCFQIISFSTSRMINGEKKNFKSAWKVIYCDCDTEEIEDS